MLRGKSRGLQLPGVLSNPHPHQNGNANENSNTSQKHSHALAGNNWDISGITKGGQSFPWVQEIKI